MKIAALCPISDKKVNENVTRLNGAFTVSLIIVYLISQNVFPLVFLAVDFFFRAADYARYSLIAISSKNIVNLLSLKSIYINAGPKLFAARIGFIFSSFIIVLSLLGFSTGAYIISSILLLFSFLESAFGICVACKIYPFAFRLFYR